MQSVSHLSFIMYKQWGKLFKFLTFENWSVTQMYTRTVLSQDCNKTVSLETNFGFYNLFRIIHAYSVVEKFEYSINDLKSGFPVPAFRPTVDEFYGLEIFQSYL